MIVSFDQQYDIQFTVFEEALVRRLSERYSMSPDQFVWQHTPGLRFDGDSDVTAEDIREAVLLCLRTVFPLREVCQTLSDFQYTARVLEEKKVMVEDRRLFRDDLLELMGVNSLFGCPEVPEAMRPRVYLGPGGTPYIMTLGEADDIVPVIIGDRGTGKDSEWTEAINHREFQIKRELGYYDDDEEDVE